MRVALVAVIVAVVVIVVAVPFLLMQGGQQAGEQQTTPTQTQKPETGRVEIIIEGGEISVSKYGYAIKGQELQAPGPELRVKVGSLVVVTFINIGQLPHTFAVANEKKFDAEPLWDAQIGTPTSPVQPKQQSSISFTPKKPGEYYYICQVPGHIQLGMWGKFVVEE